MAKQRLKTIRAGRLVRVGLWSASFPSDSPKARAEKQKFSSEARQRLNDRTSWEKLKMMLAANFSGTDLVVTLTYDDAHLPKSRADARACLKRFFALLRTERKAAGMPMLYIYNIEHLHSGGRFHHHLVINGTGADYDMIRRLWEYGSDLNFEKLDDYGYEELAKYLTKEAREYGRQYVGDRTWVCSRNLKKPEVQPAEWVSPDIRLEPPANAYVLRRESKVNEWGRFEYLEYLLPSEPKARRVRPKKTE